MLVPAGESSRNFFSHEITNIQHAYSDLKVNLVVAYVKQHSPGKTATLVPLHQMRVNHWKKTGDQGNSRYQEGACDLLDLRFT